MNCRCHSEPAYWNPDPRWPQGGYWQCAVAKRQRERDRYDADPLRRIRKNLKNRARQRANTLTRKQEATYGPLPDQGRS